MKRVFLLGYPLGHSVSPAMQNAAFCAVGLDWEYKLLEIPPAELGVVIARLRADDFAGANVTIPHKEAVVDLLDDLTNRARKIGAVNTVLKRDGKLIGDNTDGYGFAQALRGANVDPRNRQVVILGAGGAARAVGVTLAESGAARIAIVNRTAPRAESLAGFLRASFTDIPITANDEMALADAYLFVNATSVGMSPHSDASPFPIAFRRGAVAFDLVYRPADTRFLNEAARAGAQTIGGLGMLVHQGAAAFTLWTGRDAPINVMFQAAEAALREPEHAT
jgi:shikimate dehydrogenase